MNILPPTKGEKVAAFGYASTSVVAETGQQVYRSGQSHPFPGGLKVIDWRHEPVSDFFSYRSAAAQFC
jgi:hypothetical protein